MDVPRAARGTGMTGVGRSGSRRKDDGRGQRSWRDRADSCGLARRRVFLRLVIVLGELRILGQFSVIRQFCERRVLSGQHDSSGDRRCLRVPRCDALVSWEGSLEDQTTAFESQIQRLDEPEEIKGAILSFLGAASDGRSS